MNYDMELKVKQVMAAYYRRKAAALGIGIIAVFYMIYLAIFRMDYRVRLVVGGFASFLLTLSIFIVYMILLLLMIYMMHFAWSAISATLSKDCDPYIYEACMRRLTIRFYKDRVSCNHAVARYNQGDFEGAWEILQHINVYKLKGTFKLNYYILMSALCFKKGMGAHAAELEQTYRGGMKKKKDQIRFQILCADNNFIRAMQNKDYRMAFQFIREREELNGNISCRFHRVSSSMKEAEIYAAMGNKESAGLKLAYVIKNGGRLFYVNEAKNLLEKLEIDWEDI